MFYNILIISDNINLCVELQKILNNKIHKNQSIDYSISPYSDIDLFSTKLSCKVIQYDLKNDYTIDSLISKYDLIISIHCKQFFPKKLVNKIKCINIHPGYNPINRGWYPQVFAIINDKPIGATIHEIDEELDHGLIIAQDYVEIDKTDTSLSLYNKILEKEIELFKQNIDSIITNRYKTIIPSGEENIYLKKDFNNLCEINLNKKSTYGEVIDHLRALTHGEFQNAFFIDPKTNEKIYISVNLNKKNN